MTGKTADDLRLEEKAARKQADLARRWKRNEQYEDALKVRETDPQAFATLSADHRAAILGYYKPMRDAAKAAGVDVTKGGSR